MHKLFKINNLCIYYEAGDIRGEAVAEAGLVVVGFPEGSGEACHGAEVLADFVEELCAHLGVRESFEAQDSSDEHVDAIQRGVSLRFQKPFPPGLPFGLRFVNDPAEVGVVLADFAGARGGLERSVLLTDGVVVEILPVEGAGEDFASDGLGTDGQFRFVQPFCGDAQEFAIEHVGWEVAPVHVLL